MEDEEPTPLLWNAWAEESPAPSEKPLFKPVTHLRPEHYYLLTLDLSAISYDKNVKGTYTQPAATAFRDLVNQWKNLEDDVSLTMVILPDSTYFESEKPSDVMKVDLKKIKEYDEKGLPSPNQDPFTILARERGKNQNFVFGRVAFRVKTKLLVGETESLAPISFSIWVNNIPVDEISVRWCMASTETLPTTCQGIGLSQFGLRGGDSLAVASETSRSPNAALTFVEVGPKKVYGVFWRSDKPGYFSWPIEENAEQLTKTLVNEGNAFVKSRDDENELQKRAGGLYNTLFPEKKARQAFESYLKPILQKDPSMETYKAPSIFVRMVQYGEGTTLRIPLGMMAVRLDDGPSGKAKFLGFYFRIETPLERQSYQVSSNCLSDWIMVFPKLNVPDDPLKKAIGRVKNRIPAWRAEAREKFEDIREFGDWIAEETPVVQTALMVLSHHAEDRLTFEPANLVHAKEALREFQRPSVAILSGCATATPGSGAVGFVSQFNQHGIDTVIATSTEVDAHMAGDFLDTLATVVKDKEGDANFSIADAYFKTLQELKRKVPPDGTSAYGSRVLEYNLLGNGNIRLCSPKKR